MGGPQAPLAPPPSTEPNKREPTENKPAAPGDGFERSAGAKRAPDKMGNETTAGAAAAPRVESDQRFNEMLRQTKNDPKALAQLAQTLTMTQARFAAEFNNDKSKAGQLLDKLTEQRFAQGAVEQTRAELGQLRERMHTAKQRMSVQKRRLRALKQLAGRVGDSRLADELANIEARVELLDTGWAESFVGLGLGKVIYSPENPDTPEHLRKVVKASVQNTKRAQDAEALGDLLSEMHPARLVTRVATREVAGEAPRSKEVIAAVRKEAGGAHGRTMQAFAALYQLFEEDAE